MSMRTGFPDTIKFTSAMEELELAHAQHCSIAALARPFQQAISIASIAVEIFTKEQNSECPELPDAYLRFKYGSRRARCWQCAITAPNFDESSSMDSIFETAAAPGKAWRMSPLQERGIARLFR